MASLKPDEVRKALVVVAVETVLLKMGKSVYDQVISNLQKNYRCYLPDCYERPENLKGVLQDLFGNSSITIIESIKKQLEEYNAQKGIDVFIAGIND